MSQLLPPRPVRVFSCRNTDAEGNGPEVEITPEILERAERYAREWHALFGRFPQGQHPLKFPVNRQITLDEADLILEFPVDPLTLLRALLDAARAEYSIYRHGRNVFSAEDGVEKGFGELRNMAPTLILRCDGDCVAAIISGETRIAYKQLRKTLGVKNVSLASAGEVRQVTGADVGCVSMVNPGLRTIVDRRLLDVGEVFGGCGLPGYSLRIRVADLVAVTCAEVFAFTSLKDRQ